MHRVTKRVSWLVNHWLRNLQFSRESVPRPSSANSKTVEWLSALSRPWSRTIKVTRNKSKRRTNLKSISTWQARNKSNNLLPGGRTTSQAAVTHSSHPTRSVSRTSGKCSLLAMHRAASEQVRMASDAPGQPCESKAVSELGWQKAILSLLIRSCLWRANFNCPNSVLLAELIWFKFTLSSRCILLLSVVWAGLKPPISQHSPVHSP